MLPAVTSGWVEVAGSAMAVESSHRRAEYTRALMAWPRRNAPVLVLGLALLAAALLLLVLDSRLTFFQDTFELT